MLHSPPEYDDATMAGNTGHGPAVGRLARDGDAQAEDVSEPWLEKSYPLSTEKDSKEKLQKDSRTKN